MLHGVEAIEREEEQAWKEKAHLKGSCREPEEREGQLGQHGSRKRKKANHVLWR